MSQHKFLHSLQQNYVYFQGIVPKNYIKISKDPITTHENSDIFKNLTARRKSADNLDDDVFHSSGLRSDLNAELNAAVSEIANLTLGVENELDDPQQNLL